MKSAADFRHFSQAGRDLADLHLHYETVAMYPGATVDTGGNTLTDADYRVEKMKYGKQGKIKDLTTLHYNAKISVTGIRWRPTTTWSTANPRSTGWWNASA